MSAGVTVKGRPTTGSVRSDGCDHYYEEAGEAVAILLIHPSGATASTWGSATGELARIGRGITYDRRGYARIDQGREPQDKGARSGWRPDVGAAAPREAPPMSRYLIQHRLEPQQCGAVFASFKGRPSPLRHQSARTPSRRRPREEHLPFIMARAHERDARRRYQAAIAAAIESLRHAEQRFDASSAAIDMHIQRALAAGSLTAYLVAVSGREPIKADAVAATLATAEATPA